MIRYISHKQIDKILWDKCITHAPNKIIYAYSWYLDIVCPNWHALILDDYKFVMPLPQRTKWGIHYIFPPYFSQQLGIYGGAVPSKAIVNEFLNAVPRKFTLVTLKLNMTNTCDTQEYLLTPQINYVLPLRQHYEMIKSSYHINTVKNIMKAKKAGVTIVNDDDPNILLSMFKQFIITKLERFSKRDLALLERLITACLSKGKGFIAYALDEHKNVCAGVFFLKDDDRLIHLVPVSNDTGRETSAMFLLLDHVIREYAGSPRVLDFEGSNIEGLARFYSGFGSQRQTYCSASRKHLPKFIAFFYSLLHNKR